MGMRYCTNKLSSLFETTYIYEKFNVDYKYMLFVLVQNCVCVDGIYLLRQMGKTFNFHFDGLD